MISPGSTRLRRPDLVRQREVSALEPVDAAIANIECLDGRLNAVVHRRFERARAEAMTPTDGRFAGLPLLVKDLIAYSHGDPLDEGLPRCRQARVSRPS